MIFKKKQPNFAKQIAITPPEPHSNRSGLAVVLIARDEEPYIEEWARFHLHAGVRHIYAYDDGSRDGTFDVLRSAVPRDQLTVTPWKNCEPKDVRRDRYLDNQVLAYVHAVANFGSLYQWMTFIDADEFIVPKGAKTIVEALEKVGGHPNVSLPWHMFGRSGHGEQPAGGVVANYTERGADPLTDLEGVRNFKCIVDPCEVTQVAIHGFLTRSHGDITCNDVGQTFSLQDRSRQAFYSADNLQLNHYYSKSEAELQRKLDRGSASPISNSQYRDQVRRTLANIESNTVEDRCAQDFLKSVDGAR